MSRKSLDIVRIERCLKVPEIAAIAEWCERRGIPLNDWCEHPGALAWIDLAVGRATDDAMRDNPRLSRSAALRYVCGRFGLDGDNLRRRWAKTRSEYLRRRRDKHRAQTGDFLPPAGLADRDKLSA